jgi:hypothetical protein
LCGQGSGRKSRGASFVGKENGGGFPPKAAALIIQNLKWQIRDTNICTRELNLRIQMFNHRIQRFKH